MRPFLAVALLYLGVTTAFKTRSNIQACPLLGQEYPPPVQLTAEPKFQAVTKDLNAKLDQQVKQSSSYEDTAFSVGMFSTSDDGLIYQYHHTSPAVANSTYGTRKVDANSIYRIGSISKLLTVYTMLVHVGDKHFSDPVADHLPELLKYSADLSNSETPLWSDITLGDLAGQMAGFTRDYGLPDVAVLGNGLAALRASINKAFPDIPQDQVPTCGYQTSNGSFAMCSDDGVANESPLFRTAYTQVYSNEAFAIIGLALSRITGQPMETMFNETLRNELSLSNTYYNTPSEITEFDVIPGTLLKAGWAVDFGPFAPAGGFFSSLNDLRTLGKATLTSRLLSKSVTNRWFKPTSFVESFAQGVGRPWEIYRYKVNGQSVDVYTKAGDYGVYHSFLALVPAYNFGAAALIAGDESVRTDSPKVLFDAILPVLDEVAQDQAASNFAGHYASNQANSSLTITTSGVESGLKVTQWISNGVDILGELIEPQIPNLVFRIIPNQLYGDDDSRVGFTSFYESATPPPANNDPVFTCIGWFDVDELLNGNIPLGQMVFDIDDHGKASAVQLRALRATLEKRS